MNKMTIPNGHRIVETKKRLAIDDAVSVLAGRAQTHVTLAKKDGDDAEIVAHQIVCPHCRGSVPAYERFFNTFGPAPDKLSPDTVDAWGGAQLCLWPDGSDTLVFNSVYQPEGIYKCPHCHQVSFPLRGVTEVSIEETDNKITLTATCTDIFCNASANMLGKKFLVERVKSRCNCTDLHKNIRAVSIVFNHILYATDLPFNATEPVDK